RSLGQTDLALTAWHKVFQEYTKLANQRGMWHACTTGSCFLAVATTANTPDAAASICALARDMIAVARRQGNHAQVPLSATVGIDIGPVALRGDHATRRLIDLWGNVAVDARRLQQRAAAHKIHISARVSALLEDTELRSRTDLADDQASLV